MGLIKALPGNGDSTHDYVRHGTATLFAALNTLTGEVIAMCADRHRHQDWLRFLKQVDSEVPADLDVHLIADNYATHKHAKVKRCWSAIHGSTCPTPTSASWLNMVERFFRDHDEAHPSRRVPKRSGTHRWDHGLHRRPQPRPQALHLDRQGQGHPGEGQAGTKGASG